jgi:hypothetical protein
MISRRLLSNTFVSVVVIFAALTTTAATAVRAPDDAAAAAGAGAPANACPPVKDVVNRGYHADNMCNRQYFNTYKETVRRDQIYQSLRQEGGSLRVPNVKTITCPSTNHNNNHGEGGAPVDTLIQKGSRQGYDTTWFVENTSSVAVVLCWIDPVTGQEYSAVDSSIAPPVRDPRAILKPGEWKAVWTYEGHVFYARALDPETGQAGRIVLQHRTGLYPVGEGVAGLSCPEGDVEPIEAETGVLAPAFTRSVPPGKHLRRCNQIDIGFRNAANCPLHAYYIPDHHARLAAGTGTSANATTQCPVEEFKLHLGLEGTTPDFHWDWASNTKFEGSAIGHSFAFRLASNPSVLVETVTLEPTKVIDCPDPRSEESVVQITADSIILPVRGRHHNKNGLNATTITETLLLLDYYANATSSLPEEYYAKAEGRGGVGAGAARGGAGRYGAASAVSF